MARSAQDATIGHRGVPTALNPDRRRMCWLRRTPIVVLVALVTGLALLIVGSITILLLARTGLDRLIVPGATDIEVRSSGLGEQQITYRAAGSPYRWYFTVARNLAADGWAVPVDSRVRLHTTPDIHWRIWPLWFVYIKERVALQGDPNVARITISREVIIPWRQYLP